MRAPAAAAVALLAVALSTATVSADDNLEKLYLAQNGRLTPEQREQFDRLDPAERRRLEQNFERYRSLPPDERRQLDRQYERWRELPPEHQERLRQRFQQLERSPAPPAPREPGGASPPPVRGR